MFKFYYTILFFYFSVSTRLVADTIAIPFFVKNVDPSSIQIQQDKIVILEYNSRIKPTIVFQKTFNGKDCFINSKIPCGPQSSIPLELDETNIPKTFNLTYSLNSKIHKKTIQLLPDDFNTYKVVGKSVIKSSLIFSRILVNENGKMLDSSDLFVLNESGNILFYKRLPFVAADFRPHYLGTTQYFSYLKTTKSFLGVSLVGHRTLLNDNFQRIKTFPELLDLHEFLLLDINWYMSTKYELGLNSFGGYFLNQELIEMKNGKQIFNFGIKDLLSQNYFPSYTLISEFDGKMAAHPYHLNAFELLGNGEILLSLGYDSVLIIDKKTKKLKMAFSGPNDQFKLSTEQKIAYFHTPLYDSSTQTLTVFDNGLYDVPYRIIEYKLNRNTKKVEKFTLISTSKTISKSMGSVVKQGNIYSISPGARGNIGFDFIEQIGTKVSMTISFKKPNGYSYRIYRSKI